MGREKQKVGKEKKGLGKGVGEQASLDGVGAGRRGCKGWTFDRGFEKEKIGRGRVGKEWIGERLIEKGWEQPHLDEEIRSELVAFLEANEEWKETVKRQRVLW